MNISWVLKLRCVNYFSLSFQILDWIMVLTNFSFFLNWNHHLKTFKKKKKKNDNFPQMWNLYSLHRWLLLIWLKFYIYKIVGKINVHIYQKK